MARGSVTVALEERGASIDVCSVLRALFSDRLLNLLFRPDVEPKIPDVYWCCEALVEKVRVENPKLTVL